MMDTQILEEPRTLFQASVRCSCEEKQQLGMKYVLALIPLPVL